MGHTGVFPPTWPNKNSMQHEQWALCVEIPRLKNSYFWTTKHCITGSNTPWYQRTNSALLVCVLLHMKCLPGLAILPHLLTTLLPTPVKVITYSNKKIDFITWLVWYRFIFACIHDCGAENSLDLGSIWKRIALLSLPETLHKLTPWSPQLQ